MKTANKPTIPEIIFFLVYFAFLIAVCSFYIFLKHNERDIYFAGCIFPNSSISLAVPFLSCIFSVYEAVDRLKKTEDNNKRRSLKSHLLIVSVFGTAFLGFTVWDIADTYIGSKDKNCREIIVDDGKTVLLEETREKSTITNNSYDYIYVYRKYGSTVRRLGRIYEDRYTNSPMIANDHYSWEYNGEKFTLYLDYGDLCDGVKWRDGVEPPEYISEEYTLN